MEWIDRGELKPKIKLYTQKEVATLMLCAYNKIFITNTFSRSAAICQSVAEV